MKFFNSISVLSTRKEPVSTQEVKAAFNAKPKMRSLEDILASTKAIKTAAAEAKTVTASVEAPKVQVKIAEMPEFIKKKIEEKKEKKDGKDGKEEKGEKKENPFAKKEDGDEKDEKDEKEACSAAVNLKMTKALDFRGFSAEKTVSAWKQTGGTIAKCMAAVKGKTNDPQTYCGLLSVSASTADKVIKVAAANKAKVAVAAKSPAFKKLAKLTEGERSELYSYWKELYGDGYAKAMLEDY